MKYKITTTGQSFSWFVLRDSLAEAESEADDAISGKGVVAVDLHLMTPIEYRLLTERSALVAIMLRRRLKKERFHENNRTLKMDRLRRNRAMISRAEDQMLFFEISGMDCDCVQYAGERAKCHANMDAYNIMMESIERGKDGGWGARQITKEEYDSLQYRSKDRALEAFEDGHPHFVMKGVI